MNSWTSRPRFVSSGRKRRLWRVILCESGGDEAIWKFPLESGDYLSWSNGRWMTSSTAEVFSLCRLHSSARKARKRPDCPFKWGDGKLKILLLHALWNTLPLFTRRLTPPDLFTRLSPRESRKHFAENNTCVIIRVRHALAKVLQTKTLQKYLHLAGKRFNLRGPRRLLLLPPGSHTVPAWEGYFNVCGTGTLKYWINLKRSRMPAQHRACTIHSLTTDDVKTSNILENLLMKK